MEPSLKKILYGSRVGQILRNAEKVNWERAAERVVDEKRQLHTNHQPSHDFDVSTVLIVCPDKV